MNEQYKRYKDSLSALFHKAGEEHLATHKKTNGDDPEWPLWYADYLLDNGLDSLLDAKLLKSDLIYLLVLVDRQQKLEAPGAHWENYYAAFFAQRYLK
jgi:hypothetical protein